MRTSEAAMWIGCAQIALGVVHSVVFGFRGQHRLAGDGLWFHAGGLALIALGSTMLLGGRLNDAFAGFVILATQGLLFAFAALFVRDRWPSAVAQSAGLVGVSIAGISTGIAMILM